MYTIHQESEGPVGSVRFVYIAVKHEYSPEVRANGEIKKAFKRMPRLGGGEEDDDEKLALCSVEEWQNSTLIKRSIGLCFGEWVTYRPSAAADPALQLHAGQYRHMKEEVQGTDESNNLPVRLIDIEATLDSSGAVCFIQPTDWSFHIISHTWSLAVRDFSIRIGNKVTSAQDYNKAFQIAKLHELPDDAGACYHGLLAFLRLLQEEGVKVVWFDALCINQTDKQEKDREISRMGAYYGCSLGCYVLAHGIGRGFKLWDDSRHCCSSLHVPRWFERVWTLQEFLLPRTVTFLVEGLAKKTIGYVNHFIRQGDVPGFCQCALPERNYLFRTELKKIDGVCGEEDEIICRSSDDGRGKATQTRRVCDRCRCVQFIRKCHEKPGLYFVDREAYCFLCQLDLGPRHEDAALQRRDDSIFWNLFALANHHCSAQTLKFVEMVRARECTNEEDRVLGVLGLLQGGRRRRGGGGDQLQLRSGKTLTEQYLNLHRYCDLETFFRLCLMEPMAFHRVGMSWAPFLERAYHYHPVELGEWCTTGCFHPTARILTVSQQGLRLQTRVVYARLVPRGKLIRCTPISGEQTGLHFHVQHRKSEFFVPPPCRNLHSPAETDDVSICYSCIVHGNNKNCIHWIRECELEVGESCTFPLKAHAREGCSVQRPMNCSCSIHKQMVIQDPWVGTSYKSQRHAQFVMSFKSFSIHALKSFPVRLVLLGVSHERKVLYLRGLVCIAKTDMASELHKIGIFACPYDALFFRGVDPHGECLIGGFGGDEASYVSHESLKKTRPRCKNFKKKGQR